MTHPTAGLPRRIRRTRGGDSQRRNCKGSDKGRMPEAQVGFAGDRDFPSPLAIARKVSVAPKASAVTVPSVLIPRSGISRTSAASESLIVVSTGYWGRSGLRPTVTTTRPLGWRPGFQWPPHARSRGSLLPGRCLPRSDQLATRRCERRSIGAECRSSKGTLRSAQVRNDFARRRFPDFDFAVRARGPADADRR